MDQSEVSNAEFDALADRGDIGIDASGKVYQVSPEQHIDQRTAQEVRNRSVNAFQFDHPELQPYYKEAAQELLTELSGAIRGGQTEGATGDSAQTYSCRTPREASPRISSLLHDGIMSYGRLDNALSAIINDQGHETYADANPVQLVLDTMLSNGYHGGGA